MSSASRVIKSQPRIQTSTTLNYSHPQDSLAPRHMDTDLSLSKAKAGKRSKFDIAWNERFEELMDFYNQHGHSDVPYSHTNKQLSRWVTNQRQNKKQGKASMTEERVEFLGSVDFTWNPRITFENHFSELKAFYDAQGHCNVPLNEEKYVDIARFVAAQRYQYKLRMTNGSGSMSAERLGALKSINFQFNLSSHADTEESDWNEMYNKFGSFFYEHNHSTVSFGHPLWRWAESQRVAYKNWQQRKESPITEERIQQLNTLKFVWNQQEAKWINNYEELKNFEMRHEHVDISPNDNEQLFSWVQEQLEEHSNNRLDEVKYNALVSIGMVLHERKRDKFSISLWDEQFAELEGYAEEHGNCLVPQHYERNPKLGYFVKNQRRQYKLLKDGKKSSMTEEKKERLEFIGFAWSKHELPECCQTLELVEISVRQTMKRSLEKKRAEISQKIVEKDAEALMANYKRNSLWGM